MPSDLSPGDSSAGLGVATPAPRAAFWRRVLDATFGRLWRFSYERIIRPVLGVEDSPHAVALGCAIGVFVALTPTVGLQMPVVFVLCSMARGNRVAGLAMTWISNPITTLPLYYGYYRLGLLFTGGSAIDYEDLKKILDVSPDASMWTAFIDLIEKLGWPLWLGSLIVAFVVTPFVYPWTRRYFERRRAVRARKAEA